MKMKITKSMILAFLLAPILCMLIPEFAGAKELFTMNLYNGVRYETTDELKELETILRADGYICVSSWCSDDLDTTEMLRTTPFSCIDYLDYTDFKVFASPISLESLKNGGFDNMDTVIINNYGNTEEAQNLEGSIIYNYTINPKNITAGMENTGTLVIESVVNEDILSEYKDSKAVFIFTSYDHGYSYEIDLNAENNFGGVYTIANGNYYVKSVFLGEDCVPAISVHDFTIVSGADVSLKFDFATNYTGTAKETLTDKEETTENGIMASDVPDFDEAVEDKPNYIPLIVGCVSVGLLVVIGLVVFLIVRKKLNSGSM